MIKQNKYNPYIKEKSGSENGSLEHENEILYLINDDVKTTQRPIGYAETESGGKFLVSKFVTGKPYDKNSNPLTLKHIDRLLRNLNRLDRSQIIHPDLSRPNLLLADNYDVNIIDYQWAEHFKYQYENGLKNSFFPDFEVPNNALMFESAALSGYLRQMQKDKIVDFIRSYLIIKSKYVEKKIKHLEKLKNINTHLYITKDMIDFEKAKYNAYKNPTRDVITSEMLKFNILNLNRRQFSCHDENKVEPRNILRAIPLCFEAKDCARELSNFTPSYDKNNDEYFKFMNKYGQFWEKNMKDWYPPTLKWIYCLVSGREADNAKRYFPEKLNDFTNIGIINPKISMISLLAGYIETRSRSQEMNLRNLYQSAQKSGFSWDNYYEICNITDDFFK